MTDPLVVKLILRYKGEGSSKQPLTAVCLGEPDFKYAKYDPIFYFGSDYLQLAIFGKMSITALAFRAC